MLGTYFSECCGMGKPKQIQTALSMRRLVREYQKDASDQYRTLSVSGTVYVIDVFKSVISPKKYVTAILFNLFSRRYDFELVKIAVRKVIERDVEVIPVFLISSSASFTL